MSTRLDDIIRYCDMRMTEEPSIRMYYETEEETERNYNKLIEMIEEKKREREIIMFINEVSNKTLNNWNKRGMTALMYACWYKMEVVAIKLINRMSNEAINKRNIYMRTAFNYANSNNMPFIAFYIRHK
jgi:hypothetical protein